MKTKEQSGGKLANAPKRERLKLGTINRPGGKRKRNVDLGGWPTREKERKGNTGPIHHGERGSPGPEEEIVGMMGPRFLQKPSGKKERSFGRGGRVDENGGGFRPQEGPFGQEIRES